MQLSEVFEKLAAMPAFLEDAAEAFPGDSVRRPGPGGSFSFVEQVWHLADLEREGYGERIGRLRREDRPALADFDGGRVARERDYRNRSVAAGLAAFAAARRVNLAVLQVVVDSEWDRPGTQEGVGPLTLRDVPSMMAEHDEGHRDEIKALMDEVKSGASAD